ncbi:hypothetical protein H4S07_000412, partial [Coemansia furcata]
ERIRDLFPPGAIYHCEPEAMNTLSEQRMRQMSSDVRSKPDWVETVSDTSIRAEWAAEAESKKLTDIELAYVLDEVVYYASLHPPDSNLKLSPADGVWFSDTLIDADTTTQLNDYASILESVPDRQKDWYSNDQSRVLNLIDPSLYSLIYSRSKLCLQTSSSPQAAFKIGHVGEFPGSLDGWRKALNATDDCESNYYLPTRLWQYPSYSSIAFSWLPAEFRVDDNGAVNVESYINNLHPVKHAVLYPIIASVFSKFLPLLEQVVTDLVHPCQPRVKPDSTRYYKYDDPLPDSSDEDANWENLMNRKRYATFVHPQPEPFVAPSRPVNPYRLCGRRLQAIVKMSSIEVDSARPAYGGNDWSVAGLENERIIATGIYFYDVANVAPSSLQFREALCSWGFEADQFDVNAVANVYGVDGDRLVVCDIVSQELGTIDIKDGRCLVFPNILQYKMPQLNLADKTLRGHLKMLTFYFVDPSMRIPSTEIVPPQQQDWYLEGVLVSEPFCRLPQLIVDGILAKVDFPISLKEAKALRLQVYQDEASKRVTPDLFEPELCFLI